MDPSLLDDLHAEQQALDDLLVSTGPSGWERPTPAEGWTVADTIRHLLVAERAATRSVRDRIDFAGDTHRGDGNEPVRLEASARVDTLVDEARSLLLAWREARRTTRDALAAEPDDARVPWGGRAMGVRSLATARLMETWAHGLDCFAALDVAPVDTDRLRHISWLGWRTLPYAFAVARREPPAHLDALRVEVTGPNGDLWMYGSPGTDHVVLGPASAWCRVVTRRWRSSDPPPLDAHGALAVAALEVAQAYLDA